MVISLLPATPSYHPLPTHFLLAKMVGGGEEGGKRDSQKGLAPRFGVCAGARGLPLAHWMWTGYTINPSDLLRESALRPTFHSLSLAVSLRVHVHLKYRKIDWTFWRAGGEKTENGVKKNAGETKWKGARREMRVWVHGMEHYDQRNCTSEHFVLWVLWHGSRNCLIVVFPLTKLSQKS